MPVRNRTRTVTGGPQGLDATIVVRQPTVEHSRLNSETIQNLINTPSPEDPTKLLGRDHPEVNRVAQQYLADHIASWNWVNDDGSPLPQPGNDPTVLGLLTSEELRFVTIAIGGGNAIATAAEIEKK